MKLYEVPVVIVGIAATVSWTWLAVHFDRAWTNERRRRADHEFAKRQAAGYRVNPHGLIVWALATRKHTASVAAANALATLGIAGLLASD